MWIPFVALCRQYNVHSLYWRKIITGVSADHLINDAYEAPEHELMRPKLAVHYPLTNPSGTAAAEIIKEATGTYTGSSVAVEGPAVPLDANYGRGGGVSNPDVTGSGLSVMSMTGPAPSVSDENPVGLTGFPFTLACWVKMTDTSTPFDTDDYGARTTATLVGIQTHDSLGNARGFYARLNIQRRQDDISPTPPPGYWLQAEIGNAVSVPNAGSGDTTIVTEPSATPWDAAIQNTLWHYVAAVFTSSNMYLYCDGVLVGGRSHSIPFPDPARLRISVNTTLGASSTFSVDDCRFGYASVYKARLSENDLQRHFNSMRRPLDMRMNYNSTDRYTTAPMDHIGGFTQASDLDYSESSRRAEHRHDGRWVQMVRLNDPYFDTNTPDEDLHLEDCKIAIPRHWELGNQAGDDLADKDQVYRYNTHVAHGGYEMSGGGETKEENGATILAGWEGMFGPRSGSYGINQRDYTVLVDFMGYGGASAANDRSWDFSLGNDAIQNNTDTEGVDGPDGVMLIRAGATAATEHTSFEFFTPWQAGLSNYEQTVSTSLRARPNWRYQSVGASGDSNSLFLGVFNPARWQNDNDLIQTNAASYENQPGTPVTVDRMTRNQVERRPGLLWANREAPGSSSTREAPVNGHAEATDKNRYGPIAVIPERIPDADIKRILRVMHGQPLMRGRPALRAPMRHFQLTAPTRSLT